MMIKKPMLICSKCNIKSPTITSVTNIEVEYSNPGLIQTQQFQRVQKSSNFLYLSLKTGKFETKNSKLDIFQVFLGKSVEHQQKKASKPI